MRPILAAFATLAQLAVPASQTTASEFFDRFIDPEDGWLDGSQFLLEYPYGVLPVPIVITEPAVGEGLGLAAVYFHDADPAWEGATHDTNGRLTPRSASAVAAGATNNDSEFAGGGHFGHYRRDTIRNETLLGVADINLDFYGVGDGVENDNGYRFNADAGFFSQQLAFRLGESDWFLGGEYLYTDVDISFKTDADIPGVESPGFSSSNAATGVIVFYDSLSNAYTPASGVQSEIAWQRYDEAFGGDYDYSYLQLKNQVHFTPLENWQLGLRLDGHFITDGDPPFFALPYIELRGIPVLRYQAENVVTAEAQVAWSVHPRIQLLGFLGAGRVAPERDDITDAGTEAAGGVGIRYLGVRALGLSVGLDYAKGPEEDSVYLSFGTRF